MTIAWIAYGLLVGTLLAVAARGLEGVCQLGARPVRWVWAGGLGLTIVLTALAPRQAAPLARVPMPVHGVTAGSTGARRALPLMDRLVAPLAELRQASAAAARRAFAGVQRHIPASLDYWLAPLWVSCSALLLAVLFAVHARIRRARLGGPPATLHDVRVRLAPRTGPVVLGLLRPEIVIPRWLLHRSGAEQRLVLAHEREHLRAGDPLLLAAAWVAAALLPWHPAVWWMLARLRLSVELDCDARVLRRGAAPRCYGALLIELAGACTGVNGGAPAFGDTRSHLERRLIAMTPHRPRFALARTGALGALAAVALVMACDASLPTSAEVSRMDVASAEQLGAKANLLAPHDSALVYLVNGAAVSAKEAHALDPSRIARIDLRRGALAKREIRITTSMAAAANVAVGAGAAGTNAVAPPSNDKAVLREVRVVKAAESAARERRVIPFTGLMMIDGVRVDEAALRGLSPDKIKRIEVIKGPAAAKLYADPKAANGVIEISTRDGPAEP